MEQNYSGFLLGLSIKLKTVYDNHMIDNKEKEKMIKECEKEAVDKRPDFGERTKQDLKNLIESATSEKDMFEKVAIYMTSHNCCN